MGKLLFLIFFFGCFQWVFEVDAREQNIISLPKDSYSIDISSKVSFYVDETGEKEIDSIRNDNTEWSGVPGHRLNSSYTEATFWIYFKLKNEFGGVERSVINFDYPLINTYRLYFVKNKKIIKTYESGLLSKMSEREFKTRNFVTEIPNFKKNETLDVYISVNSSAALSFPISVETIDAFLRKDSNVKEIFGMYIGIILALILYNMFLYFVTGDIEHSYYSLAVFGFHFFAILSLFAYNSERLWGDFVWLNVRQVPLSEAIAVIFTAIFTAKFLDLENKNKKFLKSIKYMVYAGIFMTIVSIFDYSRYTYGLALLVSLMTILTSTSISLYLYLKFKDEAAKLYLVGWSCIYLGTIIFVIDYLALVDLGAYAKYSILAGGALESLFLSFFLGQKINKIRDEQVESSKNLLKKEIAAKESQEMFFQATSHELRTPLNGILGVSQNLIDQLKGDKNVAFIQELDLIKTSGARMLSLVENILNSSKQKTQSLFLEKKTFDLFEMLNRVFGINKNSAFTKKLVLKIKAEGACHFILSHQEKIEQVITNLVDNSIKFSDHGEINVTAKREGENIRIQVEDQGVGIPAEEQSKILVPFYQQKKHRVQGTGLGLAICSQILEELDSTLVINSAEGRGSKFSFLLPNAFDEKSIGSFDFKLESKRESEKVIGANLDSLQEIRPDVAHGTILVIDDEMINLHVLLGFLKNESFHVVCVESGSEALGLLDSGLKPDLILLDIMMPGMDGFEVCQTIRLTYSQSELPIIFLTAKDSEEALEKGLKIGGNDFIHKPFSRSELLSRIRSHILTTQISKEYRKYVPWDLIKMLGVGSILDVKKGASIERRLAIMFTDIRDFTQLSETMSPDDCMKFLNSYLSFLAPIIEEHNGIVDKFIGDGIMAIFLDASSAILAASALQKKLIEYNEKNRDGIKRKFIKAGIGISFGEVVIGTLGHKKKMQITAVSDSVNLSSRLDSLCKRFGVKILLTKECVDVSGLNDEVKLRYIGKHNIRGKFEAVELFELYDFDSVECIVLKDAYNQEFQMAIKHMEDQRFYDAHLILNKLIISNPNDGVCNNLLSQCLSATNKRNVA